MKRITKQFSLHKVSTAKISLESFFLTLIILGIPLNFYKNRFYDNSWTVGEWLISYAGGFVRRGLPGEIIHFVSNRYLISPILLVWLFSFFALLGLAAILFYFCKDLFAKSFLLSQLIILAPISEDYLVRKDTFIVLLYGLSLLAMKRLYQQKLSKLSGILSINFFSMIAIFSHESYGIWALPSLILIFYLFERSNKKTHLQSSLYSTLFLIPSLFSFILCWLYKGNIDQSLIIHQSWQSLRDILPSVFALNEIQPTGAIAAIGWGTSQVFTSSLISQFNLNIFWHPGMWLLTIFIVMRLFIGMGKDLNQEGKRFIICFQLFAFLPMFLFVDIGRWIFMWLTSSALLFSFLSQTFGIRKLLLHSSRLKGANILSKIIPEFSSFKNYNRILLFMGLPHCCWSVGRYLVSMPIGFAVKNFIFYFKFVFS